jgi:excisionase family DNA binding protein
MTITDGTIGDRPAAFLTTEEVLGYLKVNPRTIYRLIRDGELPAVRIGRQWRFRRTDLDAWLERQRPFVS